MKGDHVDEYDPLPFESLLMGEDGTGVLWAINRVLFHPRGFALAIVCDDDGNATGWSLQGDGSDVWTMGDLPEDDAFRTFEKFLDAHRPEAGESTTEAADPPSLAGPGFAEQLAEAMNTPQIPTARTLAKGEANE